MIDDTYLCSDCWKDLFHLKALSFANTELAEEEFYEFFFNLSDKEKLYMFYLLENEEYYHERDYEGFTPATIRGAYMAQMIKLSPEEIAEKYLESEE